MSGRVAREWALWLACRALALLVLGLPKGNQIPTDLPLFSDWSTDLASGTAIAGDTWQYPPGFAILLALNGLTRGGVIGLLVLVFLGDAVIMTRLLRSRGALLWAISPLLMGPMMLTRLDVLVTMTAVLGLTARSRVASGVWLGLGASLKLWPGALVSTNRRGVLLRIATAAVTYGLVLLLATWALNLPEFAGNQRTRGLQVESLAAWPFMVARALGAPVELEFRNGATEVAMPAADSIAHWLLPVSVVLTALLLGWSWLRIPTPSTHAATLQSLAVVILLLLTSRVLSPQFNVWVLGLCALALAHGRVPRTLVAALAGTALAAQALYPYAYPDYLEGGWLGLTIQTTRLVLLITAGWAALRALQAVSGNGRTRSEAALPDARSPRRSRSPSQ